LKTTYAAACRRTQGRAGLLASMVLALLASSLSGVHLNGAPRAARRGVGMPIHSHRQIRLTDDLRGLPDAFEDALQ
jgi:hypothetical protein